MKKILCLAAAILSVQGVHAAEDGRFVRKLALGGGLTAVVAEGDYEPRSIGTFSIHVYRDLHTGDYVAGLISLRDGFIRDVRVAGTNGPVRIIVQTETAGSGAYRTDHVFAFDPATNKLTKEEAEPSRATPPRALPTGHAEGAR